MLYRDQGVVLRSIKLGETDRIVTVLAQGHGKVRAVAKGVRKPGSRFGARLEPTTHLAFQCYRGRSDLDVVTQVETIDSNRALREHYGCLTHAVSMLEATDQVAQDREPNAAALPDARRRAPHAGGRAQPARERGVLLEAARARGVPSAARRLCALRQRVGPSSRPSTSWRAVCSARRAGASLGRRLPPESLALLRRILGGELRSALAEPPSATTIDIERLALAAIEHHIERRLRSGALL